jgi:hypothetical protein
MPKLSYIDGLYSYTITQGDIHLRDRNLQLQIHPKIQIKLCTYDSGACTV